MASQSNQLLKDILKNNGFSLTAPRQLIFDSIASQIEPISVNKLIALNKDRIDRASVYRNIEILDNLNIIHKVYNGFKYKLELSDVFSSHHHHLTCIHCGKVISLHNDDLEDQIKKAATSHGFSILSHQLEIQGLCSPCKQAHLGRN